jgi:hypothetical protein
MTVIGTNLSAAESTKKHGLGDCHIDQDGNEWVFVEASTSITQYDAVWVKSGYKMAQLTEALAKTGGDIAFAQYAFAIGEFGWVMARGRPTVRVAADCQPSVPLYTTATAGVLDDATTSVMIQGLVATTSVTGTVTAAAAAASFPTVRRGVTL